MRTVLYTTKEERNEAISFAESQGETMLHDDFDIGEGGKNVLTFAILPDSPPPALSKSELRKNVLLEKLKGGSIAFEDMRELTKLEHGFI